MLFKEHRGCVGWGGGHTASLGHVRVQSVAGRKSSPWQLGRACSICLWEAVGCFTLAVCKLQIQVGSVLGDFLQFCRKATFPNFFFFKKMIASLLRNFRWVLRTGQWNLYSLGLFINNRQQYTATDFCSWWFFFSLGLAPDTWTVFFNGALPTQADSLGTDTCPWVSQSA